MQKLYFILFGLLLVACGGTKQIERSSISIPEVDVKMDEQATGDEVETVFVYRRTACIGDCPVFVFEVLSNNQIKYNGISHVAKLGYYISDNQSVLIKKIIEKAGDIKFFNLEDKYPVEGPLMTDLPIRKFSLTIGEEVKNIEGSSDLPSKLVDFEKFILNTIESVDWQKVANN